MNIPLTQLKLAFPHKFPLYQTLLHNARLSYTYLPESSVSMPDRPDVLRFAAFCRSYLHGKVLDVGIGPLLVPGYYKDPEDFELIGIDVDDYGEIPHTFPACAEFMPFSDEYFDVIVFGTSLDHVCDISRSLKETHRCLKPDGSVLVWMSDTSHIPPMHGIVDIQGIYFCVPPGAVDPFHMRNDSLETVIGQFLFAGFELVQNSQKNKNEIFLRFGK